MNNHMLKLYTVHMAKEPDSEMSGSFVRCGREIPKIK